MQPANDTEVVLSLGQTGGRLPVDGKYFNYPACHFTSETTLYARIPLYSLFLGLILKFKAFK